MSDDQIYRQAAIDALEKIDCSDGVGISSLKCDAIDDAVTAIKTLSSAQPAWNNHTVACMLAELFDDTCACNYNGIDEWLPEKCEVIDACPNPVGVACWEQFLKHRHRTEKENR